MFLDSWKITILKRTYRNSKKKTLQWLAIKSVVEVSISYLNYFLFLITSRLTGYFVPNLNLINSKIIHFLTKSLRIVYLYPLFVFKNTFRVKANCPNSFFKRRCLGWLFAFVNYILKIFNGLECLNMHENSAENFIISSNKYFSQER